MQYLLLLQPRGQRFFRSVVFVSIFGLFLYFYSGQLAELEIIERVVRRLEPLWQPLREGVGRDTSIFLGLG